MKTKLKFFILAIFLCCLFTAKAQVSKYTLSNCYVPFDNTTSYTNIGKTTQTNTLYNGSSTGSTADSLTGAGFAIGFPFKYDGEYYDRFAFSTNHYLKLGKSSEGNFTIYNEQTKGSLFQKGHDNLRRNTISLFQRTLADDSVHYWLGNQYKLNGYPGNRNLNIVWEECTIGSGSCVYRYIYLRLFERTAQILLTYRMDTMEYSECTGNYLAGTYVCTAGDLPFMQAAVGLRGNQLNNDISNLNILKVTKGVNTWTTFTRGTSDTDLCDIDEHFMPLTNSGDIGYYTGCSYWYKWTPPTDTVKPQNPSVYFVYTDSAYLNSKGYSLSSMPVDDGGGKYYGSPKEGASSNYYIFANGATSIPTNNAVLNWKKGINVDSFDVYFGLTYPPVLVKSNTADTLYTQSANLAPSTTYYYSIVAKNSKGNSDKKNGSFTTSSTPWEACPLTNGREEQPGTWYAFSLNTLSYTPTSKYYNTFYMPESVYTTSLKRGQTYTFSYTNKTIYNYTGYAYIDWNQDGDFTDAGEKYAAGSITVPTTAKLGKTNLRIYAYGSQASAAVNPCGGIDQTQLQQYIITILPTEACSGFSLSYSKTNTTCYGDSTGTITLTPTGGTKPYTCTWTDGDTSLVRTGLPTGTYQATVTDSAGCDQTTPLLAIQSPFLIQIDTATVNDSLTITVSGGTGSTYTYIWTKNDTVVSKSTTISIPASGFYSLTITDSVGCTVTYNNIVVPVKKANSVALVKSAGRNLNVYPNPTTGVITIASTNEINKIAIVDVSGKLMSIKNNINANTTNMNISGLPTGVYLVKAYTVSGIETREVIKK